MGADDKKTAVGAFAAQEQAAKKAEEAIEAAAEAAKKLSEDWKPKLGEKLDTQLKGFKEKINRAVEEASKNGVEIDLSLLTGNAKGDFEKLIKDIAGTTQLPEELVSKMTVKMLRDIAKTMPQGLAAVTNELAESLDSMAEKVKNLGGYMNDAVEYLNIDPGEMAAKLDPLLKNTAKLGTVSGLVTDKYKELKKTIDSLNAKKLSEMEDKMKTLKGLMDKGMIGQKEFKVQFDASKMDLAKQIHESMKDTLDRQYGRGVGTGTRDKVLESNVLDKFTSVLGKDFKPAIEDFIKELKRRGSGSLERGLQDYEKRGQDPRGEMARRQIEAQEKARTQEGTLKP